MSSVRLLQRNRRRLVKAALPLLLGMVGAVATYALIAALAPLALMIATFVLTSGVFVWGAGRIARTLRENPSPHIQDVTCEATADTITIGARQIPRHRIRNAAVVETKRGPEVQLLVTPSLSPSVTLGVDSVDDGEALLEALGLGVRQQAATFDAAAPFRAKTALAAVALMMGIAIGTMIIAPGYLQPLFALLFLIPIVAMLMPQKVVVGADGLDLRWGFRKRFVPFDAIANLREERTFQQVALVVELHDGTIFPFPMGDAPEHAASLRARIEAARRHHEGSELAEASAALIRGQEPPQTWLERLRAVTQVGQHRKTAIVADTLWRILESPASPPVTRAAAAVALQGGERAGDTLRIQAVANSTASKKLRIALEASEQDALIEALAALEEDARAQA